MRRRAVAHVHDLPGAVGAGLLEEPARDDVRDDRLGSYPIVTSQYSPTTLYQVSDRIDSVAAFQK